MSFIVTYIDVILPLALPQDYTYAVPVELVEFVQVGQRVIVQFGRNKFYSAIVKRIHHQRPVVEAKLIEGLAEEEPVVTTKQLAFWQWMSTYYMCTEGEVMNAALPSGLKLSSETNIKYNEYYDGDFEQFSEEAFLVVQALRAQLEMKVPQIQELLRKKNVYGVLKELFNAGVAISAEELIERYKPRTESYIKLNAKYADLGELEKLYEELSRAPKQVELLLAFTQLQRKSKFLRKSELLLTAQASAAVLAALVKRQVFVEFKMEVSRLGHLAHEEQEQMIPNEAQVKALAEINQHFDTKNVVLLQGVTGSGKTIVYVEKIREVIAQNKQVLYLLPEIALTAQIINRLRKIFGGLVGIYHSKFNPNERVEIWNKVLKHEYKIVIAARSGLFLPFADLGLVIVDEEHDSSLKQMTPAPRYHARDSAIVLAKMFDGKVILGTATPAMETLHNCEKEKFGWVKMEERFGNMQMPEFIVANTKEEQRWKRMQGSFTPQLVSAIDETLKNKEQVILFLNRRGFANYQTCKTCNHVYMCKSCDVSLTYHKFQNQLVCHYCGYAERLNPKCKNCGVMDLEIVGMGTEKIEDEIVALFPQAKVSRLDYDSTKTKHGHTQVIAQFENREVDILVGTQMVSKGLDFDHVRLVGIINADQLIHFPGYRAHERAFQLLQQVSGRAGRKNKQGQVVIQTADPNHPILQLVLAHNYNGLYQREILHRQQFSYPPFTRMIELKLRHKEANVVDKAALFIANEIRKIGECTVLGPAVPFVSKINNYYIRELLLKTNQQTKDLSQLKLKVRRVIDFMKTQAELKSTDVSIDVDP
jgi:primosomal protein N' (replication factor Y)